MVIVARYGTKNLASATRFYDAITALAGDKLAVASMGPA
jgi:hypothetical protein